jgi:pyridoxamine 5'-phosphate oxidase
MKGRPKGLPFLFSSITFVLMTSIKEIHKLRRNYAQQVLNLEQCGSNPLQLFASWFSEALKSEIMEPNAMVLSTIGLNGNPRSRVVLLKALEDESFVFYTNYQSDKGKEMEKCNSVSLNFNWLELERQVRIEGIVSKVSPETSDEYFFSRPKGSQIGAWVSAQSEFISDRSVLDAKLQQLNEKFENEEITRPPWWGGYAVVPACIEFWQGRPNRLHDRIAFIKNKSNGHWVKKRLSP